MAVGYSSHKSEEWTYIYIHVDDLITAALKGQGIQKLIVHILNNLTLS